MYRDAIDASGESIPDWYRKMKEEQMKLRKQSDGMQYFVQQVPFFSTDDNGNPKASKLEEVISLVLEYSDISLDLSEHLLGEEIGLSLLKNWGKRKQLQSLSQLDHYVDTQSDRKENSVNTCLEIIEKKRLIPLIMEATKCTIRMNTILRLLDYEMTDVESAIKYIEDKDRSLEKWFSDTNARLRAQEVINRLKRLRWGPDDYRRDNVVIETAKNRLMSDGILSLTGWGGSEKRP